MKFLHVFADAGFSAESLRSMALWEQGLFVVIGGLIGVFLVLLLFFFTIRLMERLGSRKKKSE